MNRFGLRCMHLMSSYAQQGIPCKKCYLLGTQKTLFTVVSLSHCRSQHSFAQQTHTFVKHRPNHNFQNSQFLYIHQLPLNPPKDLVQSVDSNPDKTRHYTIVWLVGKFFAKLAAIIVGRCMNRVFWSLSPDDRQVVIHNLQYHSYIPFTISGILLTLALSYYFSHLEKAPITARRRFMSFSPEEEAEIAQFQADFLIDVFKKHFFSSEDTRAKRAVNVSQRIINANPETKKINKWKLYIINDPFVNAFVLSTGHIFIFNGILKLSSTDDQLAVVLGHEMAHAVLKHGIEGLSLSSFVDCFLIVGFAVIWCVIRHDILDIIATFLFDRIINLLILMPHSRRLEWEADHVGLILAANACYDVREAGELFRKIARLQDKKKKSVPLPAWMETHPDSWKRAEYLDSLLSDAEGWRKANGCPPLAKDSQRVTTQ